MNDDARNALLKIALQAAVPLHVAELRRYSWENVARIAATAGQHIAEHGDDILFRSKKKGATAKAFSELARGLAALSFVPGGVTFLGMHFESKLDEEKK